MPTTGGEGRGRRGGKGGCRGRSCAGIQSAGSSRAEPSAIRWPTGSRAELALSSRKPPVSRGQMLRPTRGTARQYPCKQRDCRCRTTSFFAIVSEMLPAQSPRIKPALAGAGALPAHDDSSEVKIDPDGGLGRAGLASVRERRGIRKARGRVAVAVSPHLGLLRLRATQLNAFFIDSRNQTVVARPERNRSADLARSLNATLVRPVSSPQRPPCLSSSSRTPSLTTRPRRARSTGLPP